MFLALAMLALGCVTPARPASTSSSPGASRLSASTLRVLEGLQQPVTLRAYLPRRATQLGPRGRDLLDALDTYARAASGKIVLESVVVDHPRYIQQALDAGLGMAPNHASEQIFGVVVSCGRKRRAVSLVHLQELPLEYLLTHAIRAVHGQSVEPVTRIGIVTGHGEDSLSVPYYLENEHLSVRAVMSRIAPFYRLDYLDLQQGAAAIDPGLSAVLITQPMSAYSEQERRWLDAFLMQGGRGLAVFSSAARLRPGEVGWTATLAPSGLEPLLASYGVEIHEDVVHDESWGLVLQTEPGEPGLSMPALLAAPPSSEAYFERAFPPLALTRQVALPFASSLSIVPQRQPACEVAVRARTPGRSWLVSDRQQDLGPRTQLLPAQAFTSAPLMASVEGRLTSSFGELTAPSPVRLLVVASGYFLTNPFLRHAGNVQPLRELRRDRTLHQRSTTYTIYHGSQAIRVLSHTLDWLTGFDVPTAAWSR